MPSLMATNQPDISSGSSFRWKKHSNSDLCRAPVHPVLYDGNQSADASRVQQNILATQLELNEERSHARAGRT